MSAASSIVQSLANLYTRYTRDKLIYSQGYRRHITTLVLYFIVPLTGADIGFIPVGGGFLKSYFKRGGGAITSEGGNSNTERAIFLSPLLSIGCFPSELLFKPTLFYILRHIFYVFDHTYISYVYIKSLKWQGPTF